MKKLRFFRCNHCGNITVKLVDSKVPVFCCGEAMQELTANSFDAAVEKHVPVVERKDKEVLVSVGSVMHPMTPEHYINFIVLETENGFISKILSHTEEPKAMFMTNDKIVAVYEYCNLHGLWVKDI